MTLTRITSTGRGRISARLVIEGLGIELVTAKRMQRTTADQRHRVVGLQIEGMKIGASADLMRASLESQPLEVKIADLDRIAGSRHGRVTQHLLRAPSVRAFLASDITTTQTTIALRSSAQIPPAPGIVHIGTEAIRYATLAGNSLVGCARGYWNTIAQAHFARDGEGLHDALVTDRPLGLEGRRAYLYLYGDGDDPQGDGTLRWRGIVSTEPTWAGGLVSFSIDPITRVMAQPMGGDLAGTITPRGIKYTPSAPFVVDVVHYPSGLEEVRAHVELAGLWETQEAFALDLDAAMASAIVDAGISLGTNASLHAVPRVDSIEIVYITPSSGTPPVIAVYVNDGIQHAVERTMAVHTTSDTVWYAADGTISTRMGDSSWSPGNTERYSIALWAPVPRGTLGKLMTWDPSHHPPSTGLTSLEYLLPLAGLIIPTEESVLVPQGEGSDSDSRPIRVYSVSGSDVYLRVDRDMTAYGKTTGYKLGRFLASGTVIDLITTLGLQSPAHCNVGAMPLVYLGDILPTADMDTAATASPLGHGRGFYAFDGSGHTLADFVMPELLVLGAYQRLGLTGAIEWDRLRPPLATDDVTWTIDASQCEAVLQRAPQGTLSQVLYRMGYDPREDDWSKNTIAFRDVQTTSAIRTPITLEIAQLSTSTGYYAPGDDWWTVDRDALRRTATAAFGLFGAPTYVCVMTVDARYMDARIGDSVSLTSPLLPDPTDGYSAINSRAGMVVSHELELLTGRVTLGVLLSVEPFVGYNLGLPVSGQTNTSGNTWALTLTTSGYLYDPEGSPTVSSVVSAGTLVRLTEADSATPTEVTATIVSVDGAAAVTVEVDSTWTPGSSTWYLRARAASSYARGESLARWCHVADDGHQIAWSDETAAGWQFA